MSVVRLEMRFVVAHNYTFKISPHLERREKVCVVSLCPSLLSCHARRIIYCICGLNSYLVQLSHDPNERRENGSNEWEFEGEDRPGLLTHTHSHIRGRKSGPARFRLQRESCGRPNRVAVTFPTAVGRGRFSASSSSSVPPVRGF